MIGSRGRLLALVVGATAALFDSPARACLNGEEARELDRRFAQQAAQLSAAERRAVDAASRLDGVDLRSPTPDGSARLAAFVRAYNALGALVRAQQSAPTRPAMAQIALRLVVARAHEQPQGYDILARALRWVHCEAPFDASLEVCLGLSRAMLERDFSRVSDAGLVTHQLSRDALSLLIDLRALYPREHRVYSNLGVAYEQLDEFEAAAGAYRASSELNPAGHEGEERVHAMYAWFRHLQRVAPEGAPPSNEQLLAYAITPETLDRARADLERMLRLVPGFAPATQLRDEVLRRQQAGAARAPAAPSVQPR